MKDKNITKKKKLRDILSKFYEEPLDGSEKEEEKLFDADKEFEKAKGDYKSLMQVHEDLKRVYEDFLKKVKR